MLKSCVTYQPKKKTEVLPDGWNESDESYILRYEPSDSEELHRLKVLRIDDTLLVHVLRERDNKVLDLSIRTADFINSDHLEDFERCFVNSEGLRKLVCDQLFRGLQDAADSRSSTTTQSTETRERQERRDEDDPLRVPTTRPPYRADQDWHGRVDPFSVGRGDLDPFSGASPGMLMDPMRGDFQVPEWIQLEGLECLDGYHEEFKSLSNICCTIAMSSRVVVGKLWGAVPPGARFDPVGPPRPDSGRNPVHPLSGEPTPDHMRPPGYDDMFM
ncbi:putative proteasome inhibitor PI31 subunit-like [Apostichopus japonicus]|uniref:Proteasome inhibitor PI31 subunit n=1 Tax=Stichopus japonicus TaxID=307972 RepID=A0A2G8JUF4_STIJA|nr:putative proteasome inhibitor PI31 subunit-like [Apostichopus japonicus]